jgi:uncharacterized protein (TIGR00255 family)
VKSVNHRFLEISVKTPDGFSDWEAKIRQNVKKLIRRGKVDVFVDIDIKAPMPLNPFSVFFKANWFILLVNVLRILFTITTDKNKMWERVENTILGEALLEFDRSREEEGKILEDDIRERILKIEQLLSLIKNRYSQFPRKLREKIKERMKEISNIRAEEVIDEMEVAQMIRKADIQEEITRLESHINRFRKMLDEKGDGKILTFIAQEMNREVNTLATKAQDIKITDISIDMKVEIERIREQLNNIE